MGKIQDKIEVHVMIDLETASDETDLAPILSIGAYLFNPLERSRSKTVLHSNAFHRVVNLQSCLDRGFQINAKTFFWWLKQNEEARKEVSDRSNAEDISDVLQDLESTLHRWSNYGQYELFVWSRGSGFDLAILRVYYKTLGIQLPWKYTNELDVRTIEWLDPTIKREHDKSRDSILHSPLQDAIHQSGYVSEIVRSLIVK